MGICNVPEEAYITLEKEFYANTFRIEGDTIKKYNTGVRGVFTDFSEAKIR